MIYRIVEKSNGKFYPQYRFLFLTWTDSLPYNTFDEALAYVKYADQRFKALAPAPPQTLKVLWKAP